MKIGEIELLSAELLLLLTHIQLVNELVNNAITKDNLNYYMLELEDLLDRFYVIGPDLLKKLEVELEREKTENLPRNLGYRLLYKELKSRV